VRAVFAINHAAAALAVKRRYPAVPLVLLLVSVQLSEFLWVLFNYVGIERTTTEPAVRYVGDIHLSHIPWSHSLASGVVLALLVWLVVGRALRRPLLGAALGIAVVSHILLDLVVHARDIQLLPGVAKPMLGLGLYHDAPLAAFVIEFGFGIWCWWYYRGGKALLAVIVLFNLANLSFFTTRIVGPEAMLAGRPTLIVTAILLQIVVTLTLVGVFASRRRGQPAIGRPGQ